MSVGRKIVEWTAVAQLQQYEMCDSSGKRDIRKQVIPNRGLTSS
jgi:hypothetical protein